MWASAVNPFIKKISKEEMGQYKEDYMNEVRKHRRVTIKMKNGKEDTIRVDYQFLVVFATKP